MRLAFEDGTLVLRDYIDEAVPPAFVWDARVDHWRAQAHFYRASLEFFKSEEVQYKNVAPRRAPPQQAWDFAA